MNSWLIHPRYFSAYAAAVGMGLDAPDPDLPNGTHLRLFPSAALGLPLGPFLLWPVDCVAADPPPINWFGRSYIMISLILVSVWQFFPFVLLAVLARLQSIPTELYDAARVDGAGPVNRFLFVTLPQLASVLFIIILLRSIWMFTKFDTVWLMTQGGGAERYIRTMPVYAYLRTFNYYEAGMGAAVAIVMFLMLVVAAGTYFFLFRQEDQL